MGFYVAGTFQTGYGSSLGPPDFQGFLRSYDLAGNELWTRQIPAQGAVCSSCPPSNGAFPTAMAADGAAVYVAGHVGFGNTDVFVRKYDERGNELWSRQFRMSDTGNNVGGMGVDSSGIYIAAWNYDSQAFLRKYSPAGEEIWTRPLAARTLKGIAVNGSGLYVSGSDDRGGFLARYTAAGDALWSRQLISAENEIVVPATVAAGASDVYVAGAVFRRTGNGPAFVPDSAEAFLCKMDGNGNEMWRRRFTASPFEGVVSLALNGSGVYASGDTNRALPDQCKAGSGDVFVRKYDTAGNEEWTRQFGTSGRDFTGSLAVDSSGVYSTGGVRGGPAQGTVFIAKLPHSQAAPTPSLPRIKRECVINAASYAGGGVAPGEIVAVLGTSLGPDIPVGPAWGDDGRLPTTLAGVRILFNDVAAPLLHVSATQINAIVPYSVRQEPVVLIQVEYNGVRSEHLALPVVPTRPGIFAVDGSGSGPGAILNEGGSVNSPEHPASKGSIVVIYATGEGLTEPAALEGTMAGSVPPKSRFPVSVYFDNPAEEGTVLPAEVLYAGAAPGSVLGLFQVNVRVPTWAHSGSAVPIYLQIGAEQAEVGVTMAVR